MSLLLIIGSTTQAGGGSDHPGRIVVDNYGPCDCCGSGMGECCCPDGPLDFSTGASDCLCADSVTATLSRYHQTPPPFDSVCNEPNCCYLGNSPSVGDCSASTLITLRRAGGAWSVGGIALFGSWASVGVVSLNCDPFEIVFDCQVTYTSFALPPGECAVGETFQATISG